MKTIVVNVQDELGQPVVGAHLRVFAMRSEDQPGSSFGWDASADAAGPRFSSTDKEGRAEVSYPADLLGGFSISELTVALEHADYCSEIANITVARPTPITLQKGMKILLESEDISGLKPPRLYADFKTNEYKYHTIGWRRAGTAVTAQLPAADFAIRAVAFDSDGRTLFSLPVLVASKGTGERLLTPFLTPGLDLSGALDPSVPRPVKNGRIVAEVGTPCPEKPELIMRWSVSGEITEDGRFLIRGLPHGTVELIALCDGYVSQNPTDQSDFRKPREFAVDAPEIVVPMEATGAAKIFVRDADGNPLPGAKVFFWPNQVFHGGSSILGRRFQSASFLRTKQDSTEPFAEFTRMDTDDAAFSATTDAAGVAVIADLPPGSQEFAVMPENSELPIKTGWGNFPQRGQTADIRGGKISSATVTIEKQGP